MKIDEALNLIGVPRGEATPDRVLAALEKKQAEVAHRLGTAKHSQLKATYEQMAERLAEARMVFERANPPETRPTAEPLTSRPISTDPPGTPIDPAIGDLPSRFPTGPDTPFISQRPTPAPDDWASLPATSPTGPIQPLAKPEPAKAIPLPVPSDSEVNPGHLPSRRQVSESSEVTHPEPKGSRPAVAHVGVEVDVQIGQFLIGRYEIRKRLNILSPCAIFEATDRIRGAEVVVKVVPPALLEFPESRRLFIDQVKLSCELSHPGLVKVHDLHHADGLTFLVTEPLKGHALREEIVRRAWQARKFDPSEIRRIGLEVTQALEFARRRLSHGGLNPSTIWYGPDGQVKLTDFGLWPLPRPDQPGSARARDLSAYTAPERNIGRREPDALSDQYSLGVVLHELTTGRPGGPSGMAAPQPPLRRLPAALAKAIERAGAPRPTDRYPELADLEKALQKARSRGRVMALGAFSTALATLALASPLWWPLARPALAWLRPYASSPTIQQFLDGPATEDVLKGLQAEARTLRSKFVASTEVPAAGAGSGVDPSHRAIDEAVARLWGEHKKRAEWLAQADQSLKEATAAVDRGAKDEAATAYREAISTLKRHDTWREKASVAIGIMQGARAALEAGLSGQADPARQLSGGPAMLVREVESLLIADDVVGALDRANRLAAQGSQWNDLLATRSEPARLAELVRECARLGEDFARDAEPLASSLREADEALAQGKPDDARRLYQVATSRLRAAADAAQAELDRLLGEGFEKLDADDLDAAIDAFNVVLALAPRSQRPGLSKKAATPAAAAVPASPLASALGKAATGRSRARLRRHDAKALEDAEMAVAYSPDDPATLAARSQARLVRHETALALADADRALLRDAEHPEALKARAAVALVRGESAKALQLASKAVLLDGGDPMAKVLTALAFLHTHQVDQAAPLANEAARIAPRRPEPSVAQARALIDREDEPGAIAACDQALRVDPKCNDALATRARAYVAISDFDNALTDAAEAIRLDPASESAYNARISAWNGKHNRDKAHEAATEAIRKLAPSSAGEYCRRAVFEVAREKYQAAIDDYGRALELQPGHAPALDGRSRARQALADFAGAVEDADAAALAAPTEWAILLHRVEVHGKKGDKGIAQAACREAIPRIKPQTSRDYYYRGWFYNELAELDRGLADNLEALKLNPRNRSALAEVIYSYENKGDKSKVVTYREALTRLVPKSSEYHVELGDAHLANGDRSASMADYNAAIRLDPKSAHAYVRRGSLQESSDPKNALADFDDAIRADPGSPLGFCQRAIFHKKNGNKSLALTDFSEAVGIDKETTSLLERAKAYVEFADHAKAVEDYTKLIARHPRNSGYFHERAKCLESLGKLTDASTDLDTALQINSKNEVIRTLRAQLRYRRKRYAEAFEDYTVMINTRAPRSTSLSYSEQKLYIEDLIARAKAALGKEDAASARDDCSAALKIDSTQHLALIIRAIARYELNEDDAALADLERAKSLSSDYTVKSMVPQIMKEVTP